MRHKLTISALIFGILALTPASLPAAVTDGITTGMGAPVHNEGIWFLVTGLTLVAAGGMGKRRTAAPKR